MSDLSSALLKWIKLTGKIDLQIEAYQEFSDIEMITDAFKVLFPDQKFVTNIKTIISFVLSHKLEIHMEKSHINLQDAQDCIPDVIESLVLFAFLYMEEINSKTLLQQIKNLDEMAQKDLLNLLKTPETGTFEHQKLLALEYTTKFTECLTSQQYILNLQEKIGNFVETRAVDLGEKEQQIINEIEERKLHHQALSTENTSRQSTLESIKHENQLLDQQVKLLEHDNQETHSRELITSKRLKDKIQKAKSKPIDIEESRKQFAEYKQKVDEATRENEKLQNEKEMLESEKIKQKNIIEERNRKNYVISEEKRNRIEEIKKQITDYRERIMQNRKILTIEKSTGQSYILWLQLDELQNARDELESELEVVRQKNLELKESILNSLN